MDLLSVSVEKPEGVNVILLQCCLVETVEGPNRALASPGRWAARWRGTRLPGLHGSLAGAAMALGLAAFSVLPGCGGGGEAGGPVTVTVSTSAGPAAGVDVVFHDSTGAPVEHLTTGADGRASRRVGQGEMATVLLQDFGMRFRVTFTGVEPGDDLVFESPLRPATAVGTAHLSVGGYAGAGVYVLEASCVAVYTANVSQPIAVDVSSYCLSPAGRLHLVATARDANGVVLACSGIRGLEWVEPMNVTMPAWGDPAAFSVDARNAPAGAVRLRLQTAHDVDGLLLGGDGASTSLGPGAGATLSGRYAPGFADRLQTELDLDFGASAIAVDGRSGLVRRRSSPPTADTIDLAADLLPRVTSPAYDQAAPSRPAIAWSAAGSVASSDGGAVRFAWDRSEQWVVLVPPGVASPVRLPGLPEALSSWAPGGSSALDPATVWFVDAGWISSYRQFRTEFGASWFLGRRTYPDGDSLLRFTAGGRF
jgi:hypothetical protein